MIYTADCLVTQNDRRDVVANAALAVEGNRIADVGSPAARASRSPRSAAR